MFKSCLVAGFYWAGIYLTIVYGFWATTTGAWVTLACAAWATTTGAYATTTGAGIWATATDAETGAMTTGALACTTGISGALAYSFWTTAVVEFNVAFNATYAVLLCNSCLSIMTLALIVSLICLSDKTKVLLVASAWWCPESWELWLPWWAKEWCPWSWCEPWWWLSWWFVWWLLWCSWSLVYISFKYFKSFVQLPFYNNLFSITSCVLLL